MPCEEFIHMYALQGEAKASFLGPPFAASPQTRDSPRSPSSSTRRSRPCHRSRVRHQCRRLSPPFLMGPARGPVCRVFFSLLTGRGDRGSKAGGRSGAEVLGPAAGGPGHGVRGRIGVPAMCAPARSRPREMRLGYVRELSVREIQSHLRHPRGLAGRRRRKKVSS